MIGSEPFMYSSDFPHEVNAQTCKRELSELIENAQLSDEDKEAILFANTLEFYGLGKEGAEEKTTILNAFPDRGVQTMKLNYFLTQIRCISTSPSSRAVTRRLHNSRCTGDQALSP
jgi:hypothetical protein